MLGLGVLARAEFDSTGEVVKHHRKRVEHLAPILLSHMSRCYLCRDPQPFRASGVALVLLKIVK